MKNSLFKTLLCICGIFICAAASAAENGVRADLKTASMQNDKISISWEKTDKGWVLSKFAAKVGDAFKEFGKPGGEYAVIYSQKQFKDTDEECVVPESFLGETFKILEYKRKRSMNAVRMNEAGDYDFFYPSSVKAENGALVFFKETQQGKYSARWQFDEKFPSDIKVSLNFTAKEDGYYSLPTPSFASISPSALKWAIVPGWYQGDYINDVFHLAYAYAQGLPDKPVICNETTITTMSSILENKSDITLAVTSEPGQDRVPYTNANVHDKVWNVGLSHMNKRGELSPTAYSPVMGQNRSFLKKGESADFKVLVTLENKDWYDVYKHVIYDIYDLQKSLDFKDTKESLTERVINMQDYLLDDKTSLWRVEDYKGVKIGAQAYLGRVYGEDPKKKDAMKNSDMGAAWMLAAISDDPELKEKRLPYMRNFKVAQQQKEPGFAQGAALGQYFLSEKKIFTEEWDHTYEPVGLTYYTMLDIGNILLFNPDDAELKTLLRNGAERLLAWQKPDGSWEVAYDQTTLEPRYPDLKDYHPTFYGLIVAYKILGDQKYLDAAKKAADWIVANSVDKAAFLGVCGDVRFINDFGTAQIAGGLLEMYELTGDKKYLDAAIKTARMYTSSIYTHPIPTDEARQLKSLANNEMKTFKDWQLSQVGLPFEHGGCMGSAARSGPILLASHAAMFVKMYELTGDKLFLDMARAGALGRDAFVNPQSHVASYYWFRFDNGPGPFPHHAWWQIGWIFDYIVAEAEMRSGGKIKFPRGFIAPKVGPHRSLGFAPGDIYGTKASFILRRGLVSIDNPNVNYLTALSEDGKKLFVILLNDQTKNNEFSLKLDLSKLGWGDASPNTSGDVKVKMEPFGFKLLEYTKN